MSACRLCTQQHFLMSGSKKKSWRHRSTRSSSSRITLLFILLTICEVGLAMSPPDTQDCQLVSRNYIAMSLPVEDVPRARLHSGTSLQTCSIRATCCSDTMLQKLSEKLLHDGAAVFKDALLRLDSILPQRIAAFERIFKRQMEHSYTSVNSLLATTYGDQYQHNQVLITSLFSSMKLYHPGHVERISPFVDRFFRQLFRTMIVQLNKQQVFNEAYLTCAENLIPSLKPFGGKASTLTSEFTFAFVTTRTYLNGLKLARKLLSDISNQVDLQPGCQTALLRLRYCNLCSGEPALLPCPNSCLNVVRGCFKQHTLLQPDWTNFLDKMSIIGDRISTSNGLKNILSHLGIKISETIMAFQTDNERILLKVQQSCGQLSPQTNSSSSVGGAAGIATKQELSPNELPLSREERSIDDEDLSRLLKESTVALEKIRSLWSTFPEEQLCSRVQSVAPSSMPCWNGTATTTSNTQINSNVPDATSSATIHPTLSRSIALLKRMSDYVFRAGNGVEVDYINTYTGTAEQVKINSASQNGGASSVIDNESNSGDEGFDGRYTRSPPTEQSINGAVKSVKIPNGAIENDDDDNNELASGAQPNVPTDTSLIISTVKMGKKDSGTAEGQGVKTRTKDPLVEIDQESSGNVLPSQKPIDVIDPDTESGPDDGTSGDKPIFPIDNNASGDKIAPTTESMPIVPPVIVPEIDVKKGSPEKPAVSNEDKLWPSEKINAKGGGEAGMGTGSVKEAMKSQIGEHVCQPPSCNALRPTANSFFLSVLLATLITLLL